MTVECVGRDAARRLVHLLGLRVYDDWLIYRHTVWSRDHLAYVPGELVSQCRSMLSHKPSQLAHGLLLRCVPRRFKPVPTWVFRHDGFEEADGRQPSKDRLGAFVSVGVIVADLVFCGTCHLLLYQQHFN